MKRQTIFVLLCAMISLSRATTKTHLVKKATTCPVHWAEINGRCFYYVDTKLIWAMAEKNCQSMGGNLASVHSADEYHDIQNFIAKKTHAFRRTWLGGSDCQKEGVWLWTDGTPFKYKHDGKFDNRWGKQHCLQMNYGGQKCWDDEYCYRKLPFVCAKKPQ